jgi:hypothetical protein
MQLEPDLGRVREPVGMSQLPKWPRGLGIETFDGYLSFNHTSRTSEVPGHGGQPPRRFDEQGSINPVPVSSDQASCHHYPYMGYGHLMTFDSFNDAINELSDLNLRINCALADLLQAGAWWPELSPCHSSPVISRCISDSICIRVLFFVRYEMHL